MELHDITGVDAIGDHRLRLTFDDGTVGDVDLSNEDWRGVLSPLADSTFFGRVFVDSELGTIAWPGGLDLAPEPLYEEASRNAVHVAADRR